MSNTNDYITIGCTFESNRHRLYTYKTIDRSIKPGDFCVVETSSGFNCVRVERVDEEPKVDGPYNYKFIVSKVDTAEYDKLKG